jgi:light-regulated signal transduction histidine kinase (bacteriophytochrome)
MNPLSSQSEDENCLEDIGRASLQIVHDLKNQLNGLKLYATFLRKRFEKGEHSADEVETVNKLISGVDRAAQDLNLLSEYGKPLTLRKQTSVELQKILNAATTELHSIGQPADGVFLEGETGQLLAEVDALQITEALKSISQGAAKILKSRKKEGPLRIQVTSERNGSSHDAIIDWHTADAFDHDPFRSFAGTTEIRMALAAKVIAAHGGSAKKMNGALRVRLPLIN